eukprot:3306743-Pleurochrysis_carterae.AAC.2
MALTHCAQVHIFRASYATTFNSVQGIVGLSHACSDRRAPPSSTVAPPSSTVTPLCAGTCSMMAFECSADLFKIFKRVSFGIGSSCFALMAFLLFRRISWIAT